MKYAVGIDIGGTNTRVALIDENLNIVKRVQFPTNVENPAETIDEIARTIESFDEKPVGIGMSCPGPLDLKNGIILTPPNLGKPWWGLHLAKEVSKKTGLPATLENDANLACLAEAVVGEGKDKDWINFLTISTGVGSGQCVNKKIVQGAHGFAQEIANCILWKDGPAHGTLKPAAVKQSARELPSPNGPRMPDLMFIMPVRSTIWPKTAMIWPWSSWKMRRNTWPT